MGKPIIKWVGGKRQLLKEISELMPKEFNRYFEPFIGGGAVFFALNKKNSHINDYNPELTNLYEVVKNKPYELIEHVKRHKNTEEYYYDVRKMDRDEEVYSELTDVEKASRFIYLNKSGFNGLYRVNKKGQNNVPFGRYKNPTYIEEENLLVCSKQLQDTTITTGDFENIKDEIKAGDFVYFDPPYVPLTKTANFTGYTDKGFDEDMQVRLKELCDYIDEIGAYFMLSNSYTDFILDLYKSYNIHTVHAKRALNSKADSRGKVKEVIVINY